MNTITEEGLRTLLKQMADDTGTQRELAERLGITPAYLSDIIRGGRGISDAIAAKLGYERVYQKKGE